MTTHDATSSTAAREQVSLPLSMAVRICLQGVRARLGRSVVTVLGIALGVAFLMAVLTGGIARKAVSEESQLRQAVDQRVALLRQEIGRLDGKTLHVIVSDPTDLDRRTLDALQRLGVTLADQPTPQAAAALVLGDYEARLSPDQTALAFREPAAALPRVRVLALAVSSDDAELAARDATAARYRTRWLVGASLLITAIGITNAMLMSVTERIREIGTLRCLGALSSFIVRLFLIESALLGLVGSAVGIAAGLVLSLLGYAWVYGPGLIVGNVSLTAIIGAAAGCLLVGAVLAILAGIYPARVASRMIPASALASHV